MHTSFKHVLSRIFRQPSIASAGYFTIAAWLAPAAVTSARPRRRRFSRTRQRRDQPPDDRHEPAEDTRPPTSPNRKRRFPDSAKAAAVEAWVASLEPLLPPHLSTAFVGTPEPPNIGAERLGSAAHIALLLSRCRDKGVDILSHLGIQQGRWDAVMWLVKTVIDIPVSEEERLEDIPRSTAMSWGGDHDSLEHATDEPLTIPRVAPVQASKKTLEQLTNTGGPDGNGASHRNGALGQVWRSLGNMILIAVGDQPQDKDAIMGHVLELLAYLHHAGVIPESVYHYEPPKDVYCLQQPPTLYLLSSRILTALSDAAWRAHELAAAPANKAQAQYNFLGQEIPGSRYKVRTPELGSEVWLELVLWSCLHGGWTADGAVVLEKLLSYKDDSRWSVIHWKNVLHDRSGSSFRDMSWTDLWNFARARGTQAQSPERFLVDKTISSEVVAAYVDALLDKIRVGVGNRGDPISDIFKSVANLKDLLDRDNFGLGTATWQSVIARFLESGGIDPNIESRWLEELLYLSSKFDEELHYNNTAREYEDSPGSPSYILDPSSIPLGVLHQALRIHLTNNNLRGAVGVISQLQSLTDQNKRKSIQRFFEKLNAPSAGDSEPESFSSNVHPRDYPTYFTQIPPPLLAGFLKLATQVQAYGVAKQLLYADDVDGPLIPPELYGHSGIAAAITEYAVAVDDADLLGRIMAHQSQTGSMTIDMSWAFLESQMQQDKWDIVANVIDNMAMNTRGEHVARTAALIAKQFLILQNRVLEQKETVTETHPLPMAASVFRRLIKTKFGEGDRERFHRFHGILCVLSSIGPEWRDFCSRLFVYHGTRSLERCVQEEDFAKLLQGVTETRGAYSGMKLMVKWCEDVSKARPLERPYHMQNPAIDVPWALRVEEITVQGGDGSELVLRGMRLRLTLPLMRTVYRAAFRQIEENSELAWHKQRVRDVLGWALKGLRSLGLNEETIAYELNGFTRGFQVGERARAEWKKRLRKRTGHSKRKPKMAKLRSIDGGLEYTVLELRKDVSVEVDMARGGEQEKKKQ